MFAQPANSGLAVAIATELEIPDPPEKTLAGLIDDAISNGDSRESNQSDLS